MGKVYIWSDLKEVSSVAYKSWQLHEVLGGGILVLERDFPGSEIKMYSNWLQMIRMIGFLKVKLLAGIRNVNKYKIMAVEE